MGLTLDLGRRIELLSMDPHFHDIAIGLYEQRHEGLPQYLVHSYSSLDGTRQRLDFLIRAMATLGGLEVSNGWLRFPCGAGHQLAVRRVFLEACKLAPASALAPRPLAVLDKKLERTITVTSLEPGVYQVSADGPADKSASRIEAVTGGLKKLAEIEFVAGEPHRVQFVCAWPHDALMGLLLPRALNVRAVLREEEMAASRGTLVAPSAQK
ncbi:MAG TPA: hypothetical protein VL285_01340 [Bryobacteraceae bacterium]|nr:hypothetical protein [Bryobacteraceae bacterium]